MYLWRKVYLKSRAGHQIISAFFKLHKGIIALGTTKNLYGDLSSFDRENMKKNANCLIMPDSKFKLYWNMIIIGLLLYTAIFVPFKIAFINEDGILMKISEITVDLLFAADLIVNFISATEDKKNSGIIFDRKIIAMNYIKSWFLLDFVACFPFQVLNELPGVSEG